MEILIGVLFLVGLLLLWLARRRQKASGLPAGRVVASDTRFWDAVEAPLYHPALRLTGKPDYVVQKGSQVIPVEVKSSRVGSSPHDGHIFQLAAYCLLVEHHYGVRPAYGILHYPNRTFAIDYTPLPEATLLELLEEMRAAERRKEVHRSHQSVPRCARCGYRSRCEEVLRL
jgi:CRISPR-associated exonuclease Cas4